MAGRLTKSLSWSFLEQGATKAVSVVVQIVLARLLLPEDFGVLAILLVVTSLADSVAQSGLGLALIQKKDAAASSYDTAFWLSLILAVVIYALVFIGADFVAGFYGMSQIVLYLRVIGVTILFNAINSIQRSRLQKELNFKSLFLVSLVSVFVSGAIGVACAVFGLGIWALIAQSIVQAICANIILAFVGQWRPRMHFSVKEAKSLFRFGWEVSLTGVLNVLYTGLSELVIGKVCDSTNLGYYSQGRKYPIAAIGVVNTAVANVLFPAFSAIAHDTVELRRSIAKALRLGTYITFPMALAFVSVAEPLVAIVLSDVWLPCVFIFQVTCLANAFTVVQLVNLRAYMALGDSALYLRLQIIKVVVGILVVCGTAIISKDIDAVALATCIVSIFSILIIDLQPAERVLGYGRSAQIKDIAPSLVASLFSLGVSFVPRLVLSDYWLLLLSQVAVFFIVFTAVSKVLKLRELGEIKGLVSSFVKRG